MCPAFINRLGPADIRKVAVFVYSMSHGQKVQHDAK
jgi:hypothetical protein